MHTSEERNACEIIMVVLFFLILERTVFHTPIIFWAGCVVAIVSCLDLRHRLNNLDTIIQDMIDHIKKLTEK